MSRVKRGVVSKRKHKKLHELTKGYRGTRRKLIRVSHDAAAHAGAYAYHGRKLKKRDFRTLWITRINYAVKTHDLSYSEFIHKLKKANIQLDRKSLANLVVEDPAVFNQIVDKVKSV